MEEIWKQIENYETYSISTFGNVKNNKSGRISSGGLMKIGYLRTTLSNNKGKTRPCIHTLVASAFISNPENKKCVDHIDNNKINNHVSNLRWATFQENQRNTPIQSNNTSGIKGVTWDPINKNWRARIMIDRISINLGSYNTIEEATLARQIRANQAFGIFTNVCENV